MPVLGQPRTYLKQHKFIVEVDRFTSVKFQSCSELSAEVAVIQQWEGGGVVPESEDPGRLTFTEVTLMRGATTDREAYDWFTEGANAAQQRGLIAPTFKRNVDIVAQDLDGSTLVRWRLYEAWARKFVAGAWDNNADGNVVEQLVLKYRYFERLNR